MLMQIVSNYPLVFINKVLAYWFKQTCRKKLQWRIKIRESILVCTDVTELLQYYLPPSNYYPSLPGCLKCSYDSNSFCSEWLNTLTTMRNSILNKSFLLRFTSAYLPLINKTQLWYFSSIVLQPIHPLQSKLALWSQLCVIIKTNLWSITGTQQIFCTLCLAY